eukprot:7441586-Pyramimonas_sp.AAC.1
MLRTVAQKYNTIVAPLGARLYISLGSSNMSRWIPLEDDCYSHITWRGSSRWLSLVPENPVICPPPTNGLSARCQAFMVMR